MSFNYDTHDHLCVFKANVGRPLSEIVGEYKHPLYLYDLGQMQERAHFWQQTFAGGHAHYAMKANPHLDILRAFHKIGLGVDVVSGGEILRAQNAGFSGREMIFSGVAKTVAEIRLAIELGLAQINVESPEELIRIGEIARSMKQQAAVAFRMNPDVEAKTHPYITTGFRENKFGMDESFLPELIAILKRFSNELRLRGLTQHIGSQLLDLAPLQEALLRTIRIWKQLTAAGFKLETFDFGGGVGIHYTTGDTALELEFAKQYGVVVGKLLGPLQCQILSEPGRFLVARGGVLVTQIQYIKQTSFKKFCIVDSGMNHLIRPSLYDAYHRIEPLARDAGRRHLNYDVVGPICESSDFFAKDRELQELHSGELLAILDSGAYGASMASHYNLHELAEERII
jgi:diaminopimelate decarboxylase